MGRVWGKVAGPSEKTLKSQVWGNDGPARGTGAYGGDEGRRGGHAAVDAPGGPAPERMVWAELRLCQSCRAEALGPASSPREARTCQYLFGTVSKPA